MIKAVSSSVRWFMVVGRLIREKEKPPSVCFYQFETNRQGNLRRQAQQGKPSGHLFFAPPHGRINAATSNKGAFAMSHLATDQPQTPAFRWVHSWLKRLAALTALAVLPTIATSTPAQEAANWTEV